MGYGLGVFLLAVGLILALAVTDTINQVDLTLVGWILAAAGLLVIALTLATQTSRRRTSTVVTHRDGSQTVQETDRDNPPMV